MLASGIITPSPSMHAAVEKTFKHLSINFACRWKKVKQEYFFLEIARNGNALLFDVLGMSRLGSVASADTSVSSFSAVKKLFME